MTALKRLLSDLADEARQYDGTERAITVARRRRRLARLTPAALAVALMAGVVAIWLPLQPIDEPGRNPIIPLPAELVVPAQAPPPLPADRAVGPAVLGYLAYRSEKPRGTYLLTADGKQYEVIPATDRGGQLAGISPDGRWLLWVRGDEMVLRDLTGTTEKRLPIPRTALSAHWSPDGLWLAVQELGGLVDSGYAGDPKAEVTLIDLDTLRTRTVSLSRHPGTHVSGMLDTGDLVLESGRPPDGDRPVIELWWIDTRTGAERRHFTLDVTPWLTEQERTAGQKGITGRLHSDGHTIFVRPGAPLSIGGAAVDDILAVDIDSGQVTRRYSLPDPQAVLDADPARLGVLIPLDFHRVVAAVPEGLLLQRDLGPRSGSELVLLNLTTGTRQVLTKLPARIQLLQVRGG